VCEPGIKDVSYGRARLLRRLGELSGLGRDVLRVQVLRVQVLKPGRVVVDTVGLVQGNNLRRSQLVRGQVIIVIPPGAQIVRAPPVSRAAATGWLVIALVRFRSRSLLCYVAPACFYHSMA
jgi:hypothetical protein